MIIAAFCAICGSFFFGVVVGVALAEATAREVGRPYDWDRDGI